MMTVDNVFLAVVPVLDTSRPNFSSAGWRVMEAAERLLRIAEKVPMIGQGWTGYPVVRAPKTTPDELAISVAEWQWSQVPAARALTLLASEVLHHARVALDYCAFHAVWLDTGAARENTKFPLVQKVGRWGDEKRKSIPGVNSEHLKWIEEVQPFTGVKWSSWLVDLSNRDKHRFAVEVVPTYRCRVNKAKRFADPLGDPEYWGFAVEDPRLELRIAAAGRATSGGYGPDFPLEETLVDVVRGVTALVNRFLEEAGFETIRIELRNNATSSGLLS